MKIQLPQLYFSRLLRAIVEFDLISENDKILIGLSGGKDSIFMTYALAVLRKRLAKNFSLAAITIDPMFTDDFDSKRIADFCATLEIPFFTQQVDIAGIIKEQNGKDPCFTCAFFRRGAINRYAKEHGYNKVAYAHHHDDAVETFFMSLLCSGQLKTFLPKTYLDRKDLTVIRPLVYFRESELQDTVHIHGFTPVESPCPLNGKTKRQEIKELIATLSKDNPMLYSHLAAGMRESSIVELWPEPKNRYEMKEIYRKFMFGASTQENKK